MKYCVIGEENIAIAKGSVICLGNFDGVHLGHQRLIQTAVKLANEHNLQSVFFTMFPSPKSVLGKREDKYLTDLDDRNQLAQNLGINQMIVLRFTTEVAHYSYTDFIEKIILPFQPKYIVCGSDFNFGYKGQGKINQLIELGQNIYQVIVVDDVFVENEKVSTTTIIDSLKKREIKKVRDFLGRNYSVKGVVVHGRGNGMKIGFPTANLDVNHYFLPNSGVYAVKVYVRDKWYKGVANIGKHPTIDQLEKDLLEVHILDFHDNIYDSEIHVEFIDFLREEEKFLNLAQLKSQLEQDICSINRLIF